MKKILFFITFIAITLSSCDILQQLTTFSKCEFKYKNVTDVRLAGISVGDKKSLSDFSIFDAGKLIKAFTNQQFLLDLTVNLEVTNPNPSTAAIDGGDWIFFIDGKEMLRGNITQRVQIEPNGKSIMPMHMTVDLKKALSKENRDAVINFGLGLATNEGEPTRVSLWIKPIIVVGGIRMAYPDYIKLGKTF